MVCAVSKYVYEDLKGELCIGYGSIRTRGEYWCIIFCSFSYIFPFLSTYAHVPQLDSQVSFLPKRDVIKVQGQGGKREMAGGGGVVIRRVKGWT